MLVEKYRPKLFSDLIGREQFVSELKKKIASPDGIPHLLFYGPAGGGKTSMAEVLANEIFGTNKPELFFSFNASNDRGIDFVRTDVADIAKRRPISHPYKIIFLDEADYITPDAQACFRRLIEQYSGITRFIFAVNFPYKLINPILSRFVRYEFGKLDVKTIAMHLKKIGKLEGFEKEDAFYIECAKKANGDLRSAMNLVEGNLVKSDIDDIWSKLTVEAISGMSIESRLNLIYQTNDPDTAFERIWDLVKKGKKFDWIPPLAECRAKMNFGSEKHIFLCDFMMKVK